MKLLPILLAMDLLILAAVFNVIAAQGRAGSLGRNAVFGIRTRATMMNDGAWLAGHRAAAGALGTLVRWCLVASGVTLALFFVGLAVEWVSGVAVGVGLGATVLLLLGMIPVVRSANRAARAFAAELP